ncbi:MAG: hypothetical protein QNI90_13335 [Dinoroseobacter sp.]|nr:hypothetical protein [Dinoroseobacter sp.]
MLDVASTRARLRSAIVGSPPAETSGYRDTDLAPRAHRLANRGQNTHNDSFAPEPPGQLRNKPADLQPAPDQFLDLDIAPLSLSTVRNARDGLAIDPSPVEDAEDVLRSSEPPAQSGEARASLDPPMMRRIIFHATADPETVPPFGKTQPNLAGEGLRYGIGRFTQKSGELGRLLFAMNDMDPDAFESAFGPHTQDLLSVTRAPAPQSTQDDLPNMAPVGGQPLWSAEWIARFKLAAQQPVFQDAQYLVAAQTKLLPLLDFARNLGLNSEKALSLLVERAIQLGVEQAKEFVATAAAPLRTDALKRAALVHVAANPDTATLSDFQAAKGLPDTSGRLDSDSHAALVAALRASGDSPVLLPSAEMMMDQIVAAAQASSLQGRVAAIRANPNLSEAPLSLSDPVME